ncbi:hypothetical protein [Streptomyces sp. NPDC047976]|uniref:hypothetical protein n=1 Tax=unclassified Streptomyces TaxID=2593676 RepID=UPI003435DBE8
MPGRTLCVALTGLLAVPLYGSSSAAARTLPADDYEVTCPKASYYDYTDCTEGSFFLRPGYSLSVNPTHTADQLVSSTFALFDGEAPHGLLVEREYVESGKWKHLWTNREDKTVFVDLKAMASFASDDGKNVVVYVRIVPVDGQGVNRGKPTDLKVHKAVKTVKQNGRVVVNVRELASGTGDLRFGKVSAPEHGWISFEKGRKELVYKPFKGFKGVENLQYSVNLYNPQDRSKWTTSTTETITFKVVR